MKLPALAVAIALVSSPAFAESVTIRCSLVRNYSDFEVNYMLSQASSVIGQQEVGRIYSKYVSLKSECAANGNASRVLPVSAKLKSWLTQNGVDITRLASRI